MDFEKILHTPLPTALAVLGVALAAIAAAGGMHYGSFTLPPIDTSGRIGLGILGVALCCAGFYLWSCAAKPSKGSITISFGEILGPGAQDAKYELRVLTTVDAFLDDIYHSHLEGVVRCGSYGEEWILATEGGEKLYDIGSRWAEREGKEPKPGPGVPIDDRVVTNLARFKQGKSFRVQRLEKRTGLNVGESESHGEGPERESGESLRDI